ncbi:MAG: hypothetical protein CFE37_00140 [Alphaproteobacteria bacterium PA4]|nr:MAG: hypothetical protein CFE37_00140 [Alphaproteobacteria bacterium PA4]
MARKANAVVRADGILWLDIDATAKRLGTTRIKIVERALAGEFRFLETKYGTPGWIAEPDIAPLRAAKLTADRDKAAALAVSRERGAKRREAAKQAAEIERAAAAPRPRPDTVPEVEKVVQEVVDVRKRTRENGYQLRMPLPFPYPGKESK